MAANSRNAQDAATAAFMKKHPNRYPDSVMKERANVQRFNAVPRGRIGEAAFNRGMLGGVLAARAGLGSANVPAELLS